MRVIAGTARGLRLLSPKGNGTRPTTDRIKETLFNMLQFQVRDTRFLDLFGGSGGIAIEALSRGAAFACVVDEDPKACRLIKENLRRAQLAHKARVHCMKAQHACRLLRERGETFSMVFLDPPYGSGLALALFKEENFRGLLQKDALVIAEDTRDADYTEAPALGFEVLRCKAYNSSKHLFFRCTQL